ncbi:RNA methyltransferase [Candidatus Fermentibacteria bacterium]|nr:MAG: RNA methyltransferase [Candidatus Fermentibacteria bacterium]
MKILGQISQGLEELGKTELEKLGAKGAKAVFRGVFFETDAAGAMRVNYCSRLFDRFLLPLFTFSCHDSDQLYSKAKKYHWENLFGIKSTFAVTAAVSGGRIKHSRWAGLKLKDAIADHFRDICGKRPYVDRKEPDAGLDLRIRGSRAEVRLDLSGGALHRRGYRKQTVKAPMRETVAAAALEMTGWKGEKPLSDPMCGSGTILCEALMKYCRIPAGYYRKKWGFYRMEEYSKLTWKQVKAEADHRIISLPEKLLSGSDVSHEAVSAARSNLETFRDGKKVIVSQRDWHESQGYADTVILTNPPHGIRIFEETAGMLVKEFGDFLKQKCQGSTAYIFLGDTKLLKKVGLRTAWRKELSSGGLNGRLARYDLY